MRENITEVPGGQKPPVEKNKDSFFLEKFGEARKQMVHLTQRLLENIEAWENTKDENEKKQIKEEIRRLKNKMADAADNFDQAIDGQVWSEEALEEDVSKLAH